jgi:glycosyltransferase involved in cell wall biosynthesis
MRILYIHQYFSTPMGSAGTRSYEFGRRLVKAGHEVTILCGASSQTHTPEETEGMRLIVLPVSVSNKDSFFRRVWGFMCFALLASWVALTFRGELVYASSTPLTVGLPALVAKHLRRRKMIFEVRDLWPELPKAMGIIRNGIALKFLSWFEARCYRSADACVGLAPGIVDGIRRICPKKRIALIPNGCDLDLFDSESGETQQETMLTAVFCGAHGLANGLDALLDTAAELQKRDCKQIRLQLIGTGYCKPRLMERAAREGLNNCEFVDPLPKVDLFKILKNADVGLMILADIQAFQFGTSPNKFFDYIAAGKPVICNYPGWISGLINEHTCGISTRPGDPSALADALEELAQNVARRQEMGKASRKLAEQKFEREILFQRLKELLKAI